MKWSNTHLYTIKEVPSDAEIPSHRLLVRGGYLKKLAPGIHSYGPLLLRSIRKFEQIVREEIERTALIMVGPALGGDGFDESCLYSTDYDRRFRPQSAREDHKK